jgi:hypothetical protein
VLPLGANAEWTGNWVGQGTALIFGEGPFNCSNISYQVSRQTLPNQSFTLTRSGSTQQCGPYEVIPATLRSTIADGSVWTTTNSGELRRIGSYSETLIDVDFDCIDCSPGIGRIKETARFVSPNSYQLSSRTYATNGELLLQYDYILSRKTTP